VFINKFSSLSSHLGITPSIKDDLESIGYIILYLIKGGKILNFKNYRLVMEKLK